MLKAQAEANGYDSKRKDSDNEDDMKINDTPYF